MAVPSIHLFEAIYAVFVSYEINKVKSITEKKLIMLLASRLNPNNINSIWDKIRDNNPTINGKPQERDTISGFKNTIPDALTTITIKVVIIWFNTSLSKFNARSVIGKVTEPNKSSQIINVMCFEIVLLAGILNK